MQVERASIAEVMKLMENVESKENLMIQVVRTHEYYTTATQVETVKDFKKSSQSEIEKIKT